MANRKDIRLKAFIILFMTVGIVSLSGCSNNNKKEENNNSLSSQTATVNETEVNETTVSEMNVAGFDESKATILDENDYVNAPIVSQNDHAIFYKKLIDIKKAYPNLSMKNIECPNGFTPICIDKNGILYGTIDKEGKIVLYDYEKKKFSMVVDNEDKGAIALLCLKDNYIVYMKDENYYWPSPEFHLYNLETNKDIMFYEAAINPETQSAYCQIHFNKPVIIDDKIYYDDIIGFYEDDEPLGADKPHRILYCYDIKNESFKVLYDNAAFPYEYMNKLAWMNESDSSFKSVFGNEQGAIYKLNTILGSSLEAFDDIIAVNDFISENSCAKIIKKEKIKTDFDHLTQDPEDIDTSSYGIKFIKNGNVEPILLTADHTGYSGYATNLTSNKRFLTWYGYNIGSPMFYDIQKDAIIQLNSLNNSEDINAGWYTFSVSDNKLLLSYGSHENSSPEDNTYMIISLD